MNLFIVAGPLHIINAIEAIEYFSSKNNILLILYTGNSHQLSQMKRLLHFYKWDRIIYFPLPMKKIDKIFFVKRVNSILKKIEIKSISNIFVGEYRSDHVNHIVNIFNYKKVYLLDDGLAQLYYHKEINNIPYRVKLRQLFYRFISYRLKPIDYTFFTIYNIPNVKIIKNRYTFFKRYISSKKVENIVYFIGQPLVELKIINQKEYIELLSKIRDRYRGVEFIYILHRREKKENIEKASLDLNFKYQEFDNPIEIEMLQRDTIPKYFATFYSSAIVTLPSFIEKSNYRVFQISKSRINSKLRENIYFTYQELKKIGLEVVVV